MTNHSTKAFKRAAQRAMSNMYFLASTFAEYQQINHLSNEALALELDCDVKDIPRLALCRHPADVDQRAFWNDIEHLAQRFHLSADRLAIVIRRVESLRALRQHLESTSGAHGMLRAARDREDNPSDIMEDADD